MWSGEFKPKVRFAIPPLPFRERAGVRVHPTRAPQESSLTPLPYSPSTHYSRTATPAILAVSTMLFSEHHTQLAHHAAHRPTPPPGELHSRQNQEYTAPSDADDGTCNVQNAGHAVNTITDVPVASAGVSWRRNWRAKLGLASIRALYQ